MSDTYTKVTRQNLFQRVGSSIGGMVFGLILLVAAFPLLWWNEGRAVKTAIAIEEVGKNYKVIEASQILPENEGKLVYLQGDALTDEVLEDSVFGVATEAIRLDRHVQMYQWVERSQSETKEKIGGTKETTTTYTYSKEWSSSYTNSAEFEKPTGHKNPSMDYKSSSFSADKVTVGAFDLSSSLQAKISGAQSLAYKREYLDALASELKSKATLFEGGIYLGKNANSPKVGDYKISFSLIPSQTRVSLMSVQRGSSFEPYRASNGRSIEYLKTGSVGPEEIVAQAKSRNTFLTWILRGVGVVMMYIGLCIIVDPLRQLASVIPALGRLVGAGFGIISLLLSLAFASITIAAAWFFYRPLLSACLVAAAVAIFFISAKFGKKQNVAASQEVPPPLPDGNSVPPPPPSA